MKTQKDILPVSEEVSEGTENLGVLTSFTIATVIAIYFIRKWSMEWNAKF